MILIIDEKIIGEVNKILLTSTLGDNYVTVVTSCLESKNFFINWLDFYSKQPANVFDEKTLIIYDEVDDNLITIYDSYIKEILKSYTDWFGKKFDNMFEIHVGYKDFEEKKPRGESGFYKNIYKSYLRDKKINQIIN